MEEQILIPVVESRCLDMTREYNPMFKQNLVNSSIGVIASLGSSDGPVLG